MKSMPKNPTNPSVVWNKGFLNFAPKISPDKKWRGWLTNNGDDFSRTDLVIAPYGKNEPYMTIKWALSSWDFSADGKKVYFIESHEPSDNGSFFNDLYVADLATKAQRRLTRNARMYDVAACPDGQKIACVQYRDGVFSIITAGTDGCCWQTLVQGEIGRPFSGLSFSPVKTVARMRSAQDTTVTQDSSGRVITSIDSSASRTAEYMLATTRVTNGKSAVCVVGAGKQGRVDDRFGNGPRGKSSLVKGRPRIF